jgi:hypothetical protein
VSSASAEPSELVTSSIPTSSMRTRSSRAVLPCP